MNGILSLHYTSNTMNTSNSNNSRLLSEFHTELIHALHYKSFDRAIPLCFFHISRPYIAEADGSININCPDKELKKQTNLLENVYKGMNQINTILFKKRHWYIIRNKIIESVSASYLSSTFKLYSLNETPFYLEEIAKIIQNRFKNNVYIFIEDRIPFSFKIKIHNSRKSKTNLLINFADRLDIQNKNKDLKRILDFTDISTEESIEELFKIRKIKLNTNFSYCLTCGYEIKKKSKFCDPSKRNAGNRNLHRDTFTGWLRNRMKNNNKDERYQAVERYYKEIQQIISYAPWTAHNRFQNKHKELFRDRRRNLMQ